MANLNVRKARQRREFLRQCAAISVLGSGAGAMNGKLNLIGSAMAASSQYAAIDDYKALVCVFLYGGSDSFNMFVPTNDDAYAQYAASRGALAVPKDELLTSGPDTGIGFHPLLKNMHKEYTGRDANNPGVQGRQRLAVFSNVGNLISPISRAQFINGSGSIPNDLFAHNHQQEQWLKGQSSLPASIVGSGWGGRMADLLSDANVAGGLPPSFSVNGSNYWLPGRRVQPVGLSPTTGLSQLNYLGIGDDSGDSLDAVLAQSNNNLLKQQAASSFRRAKSASVQLKATLDANTGFDTPHNAGSRLSAQLRMVARIIAGNQQLGMRRQIFFVGAGGWDTHDSQTPRLAQLLGDLDSSLASFQATMDEINLSDSVTTFTASDFGRTLTTNGDGSDHGWGGHYMVMGGAVNGGRLMGQLPDFSVGSADDTGDKGRIIPSLSINQYGALMARWMGVDDNDLNEVFPDLRNFGSSWGAGLDVFGA